MMTEAVENRVVAADRRDEFSIAISLEVVVYIALALLALCLRLAELDSVPLSDAEAHEALAAWHFVWPEAPGETPQATSPLLYLLNVPVMGLIGSAGAAPRLMTALGGVALVFLPLLWRREIGRMASLTTTLLLMVSTTVLTTSRTMSPVVWTVVLGVFGLWLLWQYVQFRQPLAAVMATVLGAAVLLLTEGTGFVFMLILAVALLIAVLLSNQDTPEDQPLPRLRTALADWPWRDALTASAATIVLASTLFFLAPNGLSHIGELLNVGLSGLLQRPAGYPASFPLLVTLLYEPALWLFGGIGVYFALNDDRFWGRFLAGWLFAALAASVLYQGAGPEHALWLVLPLAALAGDLAARMLRPVVDNYWQVPGWAVPALAAMAAGLLFIASTNLLRVAIPLMQSQGEVNLNQDQILQLLVAGTVLALLVILFFLGGSLWGGRAAWKGIGLGLLAFLMVYGLGSAWHVAVERFDDPRELWNVNPPARELTLFRETLQEVSLRDDGERNRVQVVVQMPADGAVAWQLRDFANAQFVSSLERGLNAPLIVAPPNIELPAPQAAYVGQDFIYARHWNALAQLRWQDMLLWIMRRDALNYPQRDAAGLEDPGNRLVVWVRGDLYGLPEEPVVPADEE